MDISTDGQLQDQKKSRPHPEQSLRCPRCDSSNTKFCYYNNYSLSQPRYFCKGCRRYWTKGGSLRNVPVGGGCRKNKRSSPNSLSTPQNITLNDRNPTPLPPITYEASHGLTLAFPSLHRNNHNFHIGNPNPNPNRSTVPTLSDGLQSFYYGLGGGDDGFRNMLSFDRASVPGSDTMTEGNNANNEANVGSFGLETGRGYWNGGGGTNSSWHGLINGSLL